jgi:NADH-quinone oxidoreductase subunit L
LLPIAAFAVMAPMPRAWRNKARFLSIAAILAAFVLSVAAFFETWPGGHHGEAVYHSFQPIATIGGAELGLGIMLDPIAAVVILVVTIVGACVQVYSLGYMQDEERIGWYYAVLSLFTGAMLALVLADNFLMFFMSWEIMGLCSYLLIGFWHEQEAPRKAAMKAFMTTRVGDIGFLLGLLAMWVAAGTFDIETVLHEAPTWTTATATLIALLLLTGAVGKSAQVPLHVWLPDAMAGPTPASALIHAATMVAAGVFLVARAMPIFEHSGIALTVTLVLGTLTALLGGLLATVQHDVKKVLAYSTISQLGYMFVALGAGNAVAALFHLTTHAFFKSLLFLGAGVIIHAAHTQDMRDMGGLRRKIPWTFATFTIGSLALAGIFPISGFWSKDEVLASLVHEHQWIAFAVALFAAGVTAFYVMRLWLRVFWGPTTEDWHREKHPEMVAPMVVLAGITLVIGPFGVALSEFLGHEGHWPEIGLAVGSTAVAVLGLFAGWWVYGKKAVSTESIRDRMGYGYDVLVNKFYFDITYEYVFVRPYQALAAWLARFDLSVIDGVVNGVAAAWRWTCDRSASFDLSVIDGAVNGVAASVKSAGAWARRIEVGNVQVYQRLVLAGLLALLLWTALRGV